MSVAGKTKIVIQAESYERRKNVLALIELHGPVSTNKLIDLTGYPKSAMTDWLSGMVESGHAIREHSNDARGHRCNLYTRGPSKEPVPMFEHGGGFVGTSAPKVRQEVVKATQIGMPQYGDLPRSFFARAAA